MKSILFGLVMFLFSSCGPFLQIEKLAPLPLLVLDNCSLYKYDYVISGSVGSAAAKDTLIAIGKTPYFYQVLLKDSSLAFVRISNVDSLSKFTQPTEFSDTDSFQNFNSSIHNQKHSSSSGHLLYTGPRGGKYYFNKRGEKVYRKAPSKRSK